MLKENFGFYNYINVNNMHYELDVTDSTIAEYLKQNKSDYTYIEDTNDRYCEARANLLNVCLKDDYVIPQIFCEETALKIGLVPVLITIANKDFQALSFWGCGYDQSHKLDDYKLAVINKIKKVA